MRKITLVWMNKLRERLKETECIKNCAICGGIRDFIKPILEYGEKEEARITSELTRLEEGVNNGTKDLQDYE